MSLRDRSKLEILHGAVQDQSFPSLELFDGFSAYVVAIPNELYDWLSAFPLSMIHRQLSAYYALLCGFGNQKTVFEQVHSSFHADIKSHLSQLTNTNRDSVDGFLSAIPLAAFLRPQPWKYAENDNEYYSTPSGKYFEKASMTFDFGCAWWGLDERDEMGLDSKVWSHDRQQYVRADASLTQQYRQDKLHRAESDRDAFEYLKYARAIRRTWANPDLERSDGSWVYLISDGEFIKIGSSHNPEKRRTELQTGHPKALQLVGLIEGGRPMEKVLHKRFSKYRVRNDVNEEWFRFPSDVLDSILATYCPRSVVR